MATFWIRHGPRLDHWYDDESRYLRELGTADTKKYTPTRFGDKSKVKLEFAEGDPPVANFQQVWDSLDPVVRALQGVEKGAVNVRLVTSPFLRCIQTAYATAWHLNQQRQGVIFSWPEIDASITEMPWERPKHPPDHNVGDVWEKVKGDLGSQQEPTFTGELGAPDLTLLFSHKGRINLNEGMGTCTRYSCTHKATYRGLKAGLAAGVVVSAAAIRELWRQRAAARAEA